jgi:hypothetical protein
LQLPWPWQLEWEEWNKGGMPLSLGMGKCSSDTRESGHPYDEFPLPFLYRGVEQHFQILEGSPLTCLLIHCNNLDPEYLRKKILIFY